MPIYLIWIIFGLVLAFIFLFTSPTLSPVPYFPTNKKDIKLILDALEIQNNQVVFDLGAGDGLVLLEAAKEAHKKKLDTVFIGLEINPVLVLILLIRRMFHPNRKNIRIVLGDMFKDDFKKYLNKNDSAVFYMYISPWFLEKVTRRLISIGNQTTIVSYMYAIKSLSEIQTTQQGLHKVYCYKIKT